MLYGSCKEISPLLYTSGIMNIAMGIIRKAHQTEILPKSRSLSSPYSTTNPWCESKVAPPTSG